MTLKSDIKAADVKAAYDMHCKRILASRQIVAKILSGLLEEYKNLPLRTVVSCIERDPYISAIPINLGETDSASVPDRMIGANTEDKVPGEGAVYYDIRFSALIPDADGERMEKVLFDLEGQKSFYPGYKIETRGVFFGSRMISAQKDTEFTGDDYDSIKAVKR